MNDRTNAVVLVVALAVAALPGCRHENPTAAPAEPVTRANYPHSITIRGLEQVVVAGEPLVEPATEQRPMRVTVPVRNTYDKTVYTQFLFEFFDAKGQPLRQAASWQYMGIQPNMQVFMQGFALDTAATDWRLTIRPAN